VNDLDAELTEETLNQLEMEDIITAEIGQLSLNALARTEHGDSMKIRALVQNKVMLTLVDFGSSHNFISQSFLYQTCIKPSSATPLQVKVVSGELLRSNRQVPSLEWWAQGYTFNTKMRVLELAAYDAILDYDGLKQHSPMVCHWELKTMEFMENGQHVHLQGIRSEQQAITQISSEQFVKWQTHNYLLYHISINNLW
jgi:hypothetical protein